MSIFNYIPGVAHVKALTHLVFNDKEGAERTMETFHTKTPIVSHMVAGIAKVAGDDILAKKCWDGGNSSLNALPVVGHVKGLGHYVVGDVDGGNKAMVDAFSTTFNMADGIPVVGHAKGIVHYVCGDVKGGNKAMTAATRTTAVMGAGAGGFLIGGPVGAVAVGVSAGAEWDLVVAGVTDGKEVNGIAKIIDKPKSVDSYFDAGLSLFGDGMAGYSGGKLAEKMVSSPKMGNKAAGGNTDSGAVAGENADPGAVAGGSTDPGAVAGGNTDPVAAAQQLVEDYDSGRINWKEYQQKWDEMKPKAGFNNAPPKNVNSGQYNTHAAKEMAKDSSKEMAASSQRVLLTTEANGNQPPQQPAQNNRPNTVDPVLELRRELTSTVRDVRQRMLQDTGREWSPAVRQFQREAFARIYTFVSELLLKYDYSVSIQPSDQSIANLVISSPDGSWREVIEYQVADYLDVHDQLIRQQFPLDPQSPCPTVLSATFEGSQLVLSRQGDHGGTTNVIYGIRCRVCDRRLGPGNINYVGQTARSVHARVCGEHARCVARTINEGFSENASRRPMYEHAANHFPHDLSRNIQPRDVFRLVMEVILLPTGSDDLRSWECFWQFFCHCRVFFWGWSQR